MTDLVRRDPLSSLFGWPRWFDEEDFATSQRGLKVKETDTDILAEVVVAGVPAKDVEIHIEDGVLTVKAEKSKEEKSTGEYRSSTYQYYYTCALSGGQWDKADADIKDGVVTIRIPKTKASRPRKITVKAKKSK